METILNFGATVATEVHCEDVTSTGIRTVFLAVRGRWSEAATSRISIFCLHLSPIETPTKITAAVPMPFRGRSSSNLRRSNGEQHWLVKSHFLGKRRRALCQARTPRSRPQTNEFLWPVIPPLQISAKCLAVMSQSRHICISTWL